MLVTLVFKMFKSLAKLKFVLELIPIPLEAKPDDEGLGAVELVSNDDDKK